MIQLKPFERRAAEALGAIFEREFILSGQDASESLRDLLKVLHRFADERKEFEEHAGTW